MITRKQITEDLLERYHNRDMESWLKKEQFQTLFRELVKDFYPRLRAQYTDQSIYGVSFEIGDIRQTVYADNFGTYIYFNTEEMYQEKTKECQEDEKTIIVMNPGRNGMWCMWSLLVRKNCEIIWSKTVFAPVLTYVKSVQITRTDWEMRRLHGMRKMSLSLRKPLTGSAGRFVCGWQRRWGNCEKRDSGRNRVAQSYM